MAREVGMPIDKATFIKAWGFRRDPFATTTAEQEKEFLPACFVRAPWFNELVGDPRQPHTFLLFAPRGYGKTSHRVELKRILTEDYAALVLELTDLNTFGAAPTLEWYRDTIYQIALRQIAAQLDRTPAYRHAPQPDPHYQFLLDAQRTFAPLDLRSPTPPSDSFQRHTRQWGMLQWMRQLAALASFAGYSGVYILIDGLDENVATTQHPEAMWSYIAPLLEAPNVLQESGIAFKFFIPDALAHYMRSNAKGRLDRLASRELEWNEPQLVSLLGSRLSTLSRISETANIGRVRAFADLCAVSYDVDLRLAYAAQGSPRNLFTLANRIIEQHCDTVSNDNIDTPIAMNTIAAILDERDGGYIPNPAPHPPLPAPSPTARSVPASLPTVPAPPQPLSPPSAATEQPLLYFSKDHGCAWVENRQLYLEGLVLTCMEYLWARRGLLVTFDDLINILYPDEERQLELADPKESADKIIERLRRELEPERAARQASRYILAVRGKGYRLAAFTETPPG